MWDIKYLVKDWLRTKSFQEFINNRYCSNTDSDKVVLSKKIFKIIGTDYGLFYLNNHCGSIPQVEEYNIDDILPSDIFLDIGANIGALSIKASRKCEHVYAVEPIFNDLIFSHIYLNNIQNITVLNTALGLGNLDLTYEGRKKNVLGKSLKEIIDICGGHIDFLKCDCEGGEHSIKSDELKGVRRIEMEYHLFNVHQSVDPLLNVLKNAGFKYKIDKKMKHSGNIVATGLIHACSQVNAK
jgi:FkbM family methyltransferase